jgi:hypothetical protein
MEGPYFITLEKLLFSFLHLDLWFVEKGHHLDELFGEMVAASREWHPGGAPTNDLSLLSQLLRRILGNLVCFLSQLHEDCVF